MFIYIKRFSSNWVIHSTSIPKIQKHQGTVLKITQTPTLSYWYYLDKNRVVLSDNSQPLAYLHNNIVIDNRSRAASNPRS